MMTDLLFDKIQNFMITTKLDVRSKLNLAALLYATRKVCMNVFIRKQQNVPLATYDTTEQILRFESLYSL